ncbi:2-C-methyl-D-erythritol 4-phosphate cytidylyltransferase [Bifidobacterium sp. LC6]|uniref:2-C-methyl-D-erythritol 4-phosphate cytidylyltransferase n=1 Tax=Bifidobacterium colobi TaxID=2809026 RepID=A0ABS5V0E6_9BIFI|nr:IspD/TarI family cytidylyltransferase [Bifidobacterium colobi]MBT1175738.1 2-C-methyl-D-erythritol 4-phosphate cytidylyltransferase [Bifidobacterium colobi]
MANIALIIAGGKGARMGQDIPKQFLNVEDKPVIMYTCEAFQNHPMIDAIVVVCIDGWERILDTYAKQFGITKLRAVVTGGHNGQDSIKRGIDAIAEQFEPSDLVLVHDGIRPMVSRDVITDCIRTTQLHGSAITCIPSVEALLKTDDHESCGEIVDRNIIMRTQTPQGFPLQTLLDMHREAAERGITNSVASCTLAIELGREVFISHGSERNLKLTTVEDIDLFKALLHAERSSWLKGGVR